jgi:hypothetical protein
VTSLEGAAQREFGMLLGSDLPGLAAVLLADGVELPASRHQLLGILVRYELAA